MKIHCTRGCICDCLTINDENLIDVSEEKKRKVLKKIESVLLKDDLTEDIVDSFLGEIISIVGSERSCYQFFITEDEETCEIYINNRPIKETTTEEVNTAIKNIFEFFDSVTDEEYNYADYIIWWFMTDYIGLDYQYTCGECGDSVCSKTIHL